MVNANSVIKSLAPQESKSFTIDITQFRLFYYLISLFNPVENPNIRIINKNMGEKNNNENALTPHPEENTPTRFIYKIGYGAK